MDPDRKREPFLEIIYILYWDDYKIQKDTEKTTKNKFMDQNCNDTQDYAHKTMKTVQGNYFFLPTTKFTDIEPEERKRCRIIGILMTDTMMILQMRMIPKRNGFLK